MMLPGASCQGYEALLCCREDPPVLLPYAAHLLASSEEVTVTGAHCCWMLSEPASSLNAGLRRAILSQS